MFKEQIGNIKKWYSVLVSAVSTCALLGSQSNAGGDYLPHIQKFIVKVLDEGFNRKFGIQFGRIDGGIPLYDLQDFFKKSFSLINGAYSISYKCQKEDLLVTVLVYASRSSVDRSTCSLVSW